MDMIHESHSIVPPDPKLDKVERAGLLVLGVGFAMLLGSLFNFYDASFKVSALWITLAAIFVGGLTYGIRTHMKRPAGIQNNNITRSSATSRGAIGWTIGVVLTTLYIVYYWRPEKLSGMTSLFDPLSAWMRGGKPSDQWFMYGTFYTVAVLIMGVKALVKYRHSRYQVIRTSSIVFFQLIFAYTIPYWMSALYNIEYYPSYFWPLQYQALFPDGEISVLQSMMQGDHRPLAMFLLGWSLLSTLILTPFLTYKYGKRWYCSWVCGCGGLANTAGDGWRHLSDKSLKSWKLERVTIYSVLVFIVVTTGALWLHAETKIFGDSKFAPTLAKVYGFLIGSIFSGVVGTGFYPLLGTRIWCRFGCPMAAILGLIQKFKSRFRITTNGAQCISCGNCSKYCEMGIDVRWYAQRGQDVVRASCVGCGMCSAVCPRGVLNLENGPVGQREEYQFDLLGAMKSRKPEHKE